MPKGSNEAESPFPDVFYPRATIMCTHAFSQFLTEYHANLDYFFFIIRLATNADESRVRASQTLLLLGESDETKRARYEASIADRDVTFRQLKKHASVQSKNLTNGIVNAFQRYFSSIIQAAAHKKPEMLMSSQVVRVDDIFRFTRHRDLISFIINRRINDLSYGGLSEMEKYFDERLGVQMFDTDRQRDLLRLFVEVRNINVHNGGIVNDLFASRVGIVEGFEYTRAKRLHIDMDALVTLSENAMRVALHIDSVVGGKFRLQRKSHQMWRRSIRKK